MVDHCMFDNSFKRKLAPWVPEFRAFCSLPMAHHDQGPRYPHHNLGTAHGSRSVRSSGGSCSRPAMQRCNLELPAIHQLFIRNSSAIHQLLSSVLEGPSDRWIICGYLAGNRSIQWLYFGQICCTVGAGYPRDSELRKWKGAWKQPTTKAMSWWWLVYGIRSKMLVSNFIQRCHKVQLRIWFWCVVVVV